MTGLVTPLRQHVHPMGEHIYDPWRDLCSRPHIRFKLAHLPDEVGGGVYRRRGDRAAIALDQRLTQVERRCVLTHELIHDEWGSACAAIGQPRTWDAVVAREEIRVHEEAIRRLVPPDALRAYCQGISDFLAVEPHEIADHFHVTLEYAEHALFLLAAQQQRGVTHVDEPAA